MTTLTSPEEPSPEEPSNVHELHSPFPSEVPGDSLQWLRHWANVAPLRVALRHKQQGSWKTWRWIDVLREVECLSSGLQQHGMSSGSWLMMCGDFEPNLLLVALATASIGGQVTTSPPHQRGAALHETLLHLKPSHAFVQHQDDVRQWLALTEEPALVAPLIYTTSPPPTPYPPTCRGVISLPELFGNEKSAPRRFYHCHGHRHKAIWVEEGTAWREGLRQLLDHWLTRGDGMAFPETADTADRDRHDITATALLVSENKLAYLERDIERCLPPEGSWRRKLHDWTLSDTGRKTRQQAKITLSWLFGMRQLYSFHQALLASRKTPDE